MVENKMPYWIRALESGQYLEGAMRLKAAWGFTPSGVLADLYLRSQRLTWQTAPWGCKGFKDTGALTYLPDEVVKWSGIERETIVRADRWRDIEQISFAQIALRLEHDLKPPIWAIK